MTSNIRSSPMSQREVPPQANSPEVANRMTGIESILFYWLTFIGTVAVTLMLMAGTG